MVPRWVTRGMGTRCPAGLGEGTAGNRVEGTIRGSGYSVSCSGPVADCAPRGVWLQDGMSPASEPRQGPGAPCWCLPGPPALRQRAGQLCRGSVLHSAQREPCDLVFRVHLSFVFQGGMG